MGITLTDIINDYYDFQGDEPPATPEEQDLRVINRTIDELCRRHKWGFSRTTATISLVSGAGSLPSLFNADYDVRYPNTGLQDDVIFGRIDEASKDNFIDPKYWITGNPQTGWKVNTNTSQYNPLQVTYYQRHGWLASMGDESFFPYTEPIVLGAYFRKRRIDNPDVPTTQEKREYEESVGQLVSYDQRLNGRKGRYISLHEAGDYRTGV